MQFPDFGSVQSGGCGPTQCFAILPSVSQSSASSFPQNLSFELCENGQQAGHRSPCRSGQIQSFGQRYEADAKMFQFLERG